MTRELLPVRLRVFLAAFVVLVSVIAPQVCRADTVDQKRSRPNIVLVLLDNIGKDWFRCYGSQENVTPNIDALARTGVKYRNFYTTPVCSTTRVALLTGRYPFRTGWHTHHDPAIYGGGYFDWNRETTVAKVLQQAGYRTYIAGKWQINDLFDPAQRDAIQRHGFDEYCLFPEGRKGHPAHKQRYWDPYIIENGERVNADGQYGPKIFTDRMIDFFRRASQDDAPFFAYYSAILTHLSLGPTPDNVELERSEREQFADMARYADKLIGRMVAALDELGIRDETILIVTTDNGTDNGAFHGYEDLGGRFAGRQSEVGSTMKPKPNGYYPMTEWGINMPLIINGPSLIPGGRESDDLVDLSDLFPTLLGLADVAVPDNVHIDGTSQAARLRDPSENLPWRSWCFSQYHKLRVVRDQRFKLFSDGRFFDLSEDPLERRDLQKSERMTDDVATRQSFDQLTAVLDSLPEDAELPWEFRSISARQIQSFKDSQLQGSSAE